MRPANESNIKKRPLTQYELLFRELAKTGSAIIRCDPKAIDRVYRRIRDRKSKNKWAQEHLGTCRLKFTRLADGLKIVLQYPNGDIPHDKL